MAVTVLSAYERRRVVLGKPRGRHFIFEAPFLGGTSPSGLSTLNKSAGFVDGYVFYLGKSVMELDEAVRLLAPRSF